MEGFTYNKARSPSSASTTDQPRPNSSQVLDAIKNDGTYIPLAMGTADSWTDATMGLVHTRAEFWKGEEGRQALIAGRAKLTDQPYVDALKFLQQGPLCHPAPRRSSTPIPRRCFRSARRRSSAGSWEISLFREKANFEMGVFKPPVANIGDQQYIDQQIDIAFTYNPKSQIFAAAKVFIQWTGSAEFATLYSNALPGFFTLGDYQVTVTIRWRRTT